MRVVKLIGAATATALVGLVAASGPAEAERGTAADAGPSAAAGSPRLIRLDYVEETESGGDRYDLMARVSRARSVSISAREGDRRRTARARRMEAGSDWWAVGRDEAGRGVRKLIRHSLRMRQVAHVNVGARNDSGSAREWVRLDTSVCSREPQLGYEWTCVVRF